MRNEKGVALILVLAVVALLVSLLIDFSYTMRVDLTLAANRRDELKALYTARSGIELAKVLLREDDDTYDGFDDEWARYNEHTGFISEDDEGRFSGTIEDETSKIAINSIVGDEAKLQQLVRIFELLELDVELVYAILDWLDPDDEADPLGAEDVYYQQLSPPYPCKDGPLTTLDELRLVKGMTEEILYGDGERKGLIEYLTVYSVDGKFNINTASPLVLQSISDQIDQGLAQAIIDYRHEEPFKTLDDLQRVPGLAELDIGPHITTKSSYFSVRVEGNVRGIKKVISAVLNRRDGAVKTVYWRVE